VDLRELLAPPEGPGELGRLGGYRVVKVLGSGGMGVVFEAEDLQLERPVALKVMLPALASSLSNRKRFHLEARAAAAIEHEHIVTIYQVGQDRGMPFIAMQLLKGESLEERLHRLGRLSIRECLLLARQIASGLAAAHERGLIHRDVKPSNIFLVSGPRNEASKPSGSPSAAPPSQQPRVKILDFGLARSVSDDAQLTRNGALIGTPAYMAPEQSRGQPLDGRCDLFSLGCVLYRMTTGRLPFQGADTMTVLMALANETPPPPHQLNPDVPPRLSRLIVDLLAKDPKGRPGSALTVLDKIQEMEAQLPLPPVTSGTATEAQTSRDSIPPPPPSRSTGTDRTVLEAWIAPVEQDKRHVKWIFLAALGCTLGLLLLIGGVIALVSLLVGEEEKVSGQGDPPTVEKKHEDGPLTRDLIGMLQSDVKSKNYSQTEVVGFPLAPEFEEVPPEGALLIGFVVGLGNGFGKSHINSVQPIYLTEKGEILGQERGKPTDNKVTVKAKPGYAVGAVSIVAHLQVDHLKITFMKIDKKFLDPDQSYQGEVGPPGTAGGKPVGGSGALVIGTCGKCNGNQCQALGLVLRGKVKP
jgi:serine/threonine protein kinase